MRTHSLKMVATALFLLLLFQVVSAHETRVYEIKGTSYEFVVGSLEEPLVIGDKNGVFLSASIKEDHGEEESQNHHYIENPVLGLEKTLNVEIAAGSKQRSFNLEAMEDAGTYKAEFIPTVETALTYRFFGEIDGVPVDILFVCKPSHSFVAEESTEVVDVSRDVLRTYKTGVFSCPESGENLMFPETKKNTNRLDDGAGSPQTPAEKSSNALVYFALAISLVSLLVSLVKRKR